MTRHQVVIDALRGNAEHTRAIEDAIDLIEDLTALNERLSLALNARVILAAMQEEEVGTEECQKQK